MSADRGHVRLFGRRIRRTAERDFPALVEVLADEPPRSVFFCNVHMLMLSQTDDTLAVAMDSTDWAVADSAPVAWLQRRLCAQPAAVIPGYAVVLAVCERAAARGERVGLFGSTPDVLDSLSGELKRRFPGLQVAFSRSPPHAAGDLETPDAELEQIREAGLRWLFVGLGCPKQEKWAARHGPQLGCHVLAVGAAFDWLAGTTRKPPDWMERLGLAWTWRLAQNPRRMFHRYLIYNTKFILKSAKLLTWDRIFNRKGRPGTS
ncbi:MAG: WecB/TagA/CpsF family glycosyltransferase [Xanthomonadales bacterium]|nr:WecB/TagA/CpsF family glycosyltransferase [Xanthomonadales bacterium]